ANGYGKTTLLKCIAGTYEPDTGAISRKSQLEIGTLDQIPDFQGDTSVLEEGLRASQHLQRIETNMRALEQVIAEAPARDVLDRYSELQHEFELKGGYSYRARTEAALLGVGFSRKAFDQASRSLSGGEKNRLALAKLLLSHAELLLLDEPTNHLDLKSTASVGKGLRQTGRTVIIAARPSLRLVCGW